MDDIQLAIQLSLLDNTQGGKSLTDEDEDLAIAIEESLRSSLKQSSSSNCSRSSPSPQPYQINCDVCDTLLSSETEGFSKLVVWNQHFCSSHLSDGTPQCFTCARLKGKDMGEYIDIGEGRNVCGDCFKTVVKNGREKQSVLNNVIEFLRLKDVEFKGFIPVLLVNKSELRKHARHGVTIGPIHPDKQLIGLTISNSIERYAEHIESLFRWGEGIIVEKKKYPLKHGGLVTILVLFGLPKVMTGFIMAHELMHAWFRQIGVFNLDPKVEEGICQVIAHEWLEWFELTDETASSSNGEEAHFVRNLKQLSKFLVEHESSHTYGEGFREAKWAFERWGPRQVINHVLVNGTLPHQGCV